MNDFVIADATLIDGTGAPGVRADVATSGGRISEIDAPRTLAGRTRIDAGGRVLAPGFIDPHAHLDAMLLAEPTFESGLRQGITTVVLGSDGCGYAPVTDASLAHMRSTIAGFSGNPPGIGWEWRTLPEFMARFDDGRVAPNTAFLLPYGCLRFNEMGMADRPPTDGEAASMADAVRSGRRDGAVGVSWGYHYPPNTYARTADLVAVAQAFGADGVFSTHMRDYERNTDAAFEEAFTVGRESGIRVHVSHVNMHAAMALPRIDEARAGGVDASFDTYPYIAGYTVMTRHLPDWALADGAEATLARLRDPEVVARLRPILESPDQHWERTLIGSVKAERYRSRQGMSPPDAAAAEGLSLADFLIDLLVASDLEVGVIGFRWHRQNEDDMRRLLEHPHQVVASDGIFVGTNPHPRGFGGFAKILAQYVRDEHLLPLETAIRKMTSATAAIFGLDRGDARRGTLAVGAAADLVVFDPETIADRATYTHGRAYATGVETVLVGGVPAVRDGRLTGDLAGRVLHGPGRQ